MSLALIFAAAAAFADLDALDREIAAFTGAQTRAQGGATLPLDRRLRLRPCGSPVALSWRGERQDTVVAECPDVGGWRLYVPVTAGSSGAAAAPAVKRGDLVTIALSGEGFAINLPGEALESGVLGAWIRVRPASGGRLGVGAGGEPFRARILRAGLVGVPLP